MRLLPKAVKAVVVCEYADEKGELRQLKQELVFPEGAHSIAIFAKEADSPNEEMVPAIPHFFDVSLYEAVFGVNKPNY